MFQINPETLLILMLVVFIIGLVFGVSLTSPKNR